MKFHSYYRYNIRDARPAISQAFFDAQQLTRDQDFELSLSSQGVVIEKITWDPGRAFYFLFGQPVVEYIRYREIKGEKARPNVLIIRGFSAEKAVEEYKIEEGGDDDDDDYNNNPQRYYGRVSLLSCLNDVAGSRINQLAIGSNRYYSPSVNRDDIALGADKFVAKKIESVFDYPLTVVGDVLEADISVAHVVKRLCRKRAMKHYLVLEESLNSVNNLFGKALLSEDQITQLAAKKLDLRFKEHTGG